MATVSRKRVYEALDSEREYQDNKWPRPQHNHSIIEYLTFMKDYIDEVLHAQSRNDGAEVYEQSVNQLRKITAMGVAAMEEHGAPLRK